MIPLVATLAVVVAGIVPPFGAIAALIWARWTGTPLSEFGLRRPGSWTWTLIGGVGLGIALKFVTKSIELPILGASPHNAAYADLVGNPPRLIQLAVTTVIVGGLGEEIFWRGFLFQRLGKLVGKDLPATIAILAITSIFFALAHYTEQGVAGVEQALVTGLAFGILFARTRVLWPSIVAHATYDLAALVIIYANLEDTVAHLVLR